MEYSSIFTASSIATAMATVAPTQEILLIKKRSVFHTS